MLESFLTDELQYFRFRGLFSNSSLEVSPDKIVVSICASETG